MADRRTEYRVVFRPDAANRWVAQYRRWWSPFWATHHRFSGHFCRELGPVFVTRYFDTADEAMSWCRGHAEREARETAPRTVINLGRPPTAPLTKEQA